MCCRTQSEFLRSMSEKLIDSNLKPQTSPLLCPLSYVLVHFPMWDFQNYSKSKKMDFENALRATVLKIQPCALVHISFSHRTVPGANLGQIRQPEIFLKFPDFNAAKSRLGGIF
jgi:hypothetical protein